MRARSSGSSRKRGGVTCAPVSSIRAARCSPRSWRSWSLDCSGRERRTAWAALAAFAVGCGGGGSDDLGGCPDGGCIDISYNDLGSEDPGLADPGTTDERPDVGIDAEPDVPPVEVIQDIDSGPTGEFGTTCTENADCLSGLCMSTLSGKVCTALCVENCPDPSWKCEYVQLPGAEPTYACVPPQTSLCRPCAKDADCTLIEGEETARCLEYGPQGRFCATACSTTGGPGSRPGCSMRG